MRNREFFDIQDDHTYKTIEELLNSHSVAPICSSIHHSIKNVIKQFCEEAHFISQCHSNSSTFLTSS